MAIRIDRYGLMGLGATVADVINNIPLQLMPAAQVGASPFAGAVQQHLKNIGFDKLSVDGKWGDCSEKAMRRAAGSGGKPITGFDLAYAMQLDKLFPGKAPTEWNSSVRTWDKSSPFCLGGSDTYNPSAANLGATQPMFLIAQALGIPVPKAACDFPKGSVPNMTTLKCECAPTETDLDGRCISKNIIAKSVKCSDPHALQNYLGTGLCVCKGTGYTNTGPGGSCVLKPTTATTTTTTTTTPATTTSSGGGGFAAALKTASAAVQTAAAAQAAAAQTPSADAVKTISSKCRSDLVWSEKYKKCHHPCKSNTIFDGVYGCKCPEGTAWDTVTQMCKSGIVTCPEHAIYVESEKKCAVKCPGAGYYSTTGSTSGHCVCPTGWVEERGYSGGKGVRCIPLYQQAMGAKSNTTAWILGGLIVAGVGYGLWKLSR